MERWRSDCGCGGVSGWQQRWRAPLREALELLRSRVKERLFPLLERLFKDPQSALFDFVYVLLGVLKVEEFLRGYAKRALKEEEKGELLRSLQAYRYVQLSFSSDGWFFAELSGLETVKNLLFAKKALDLLQEPKLEQEFLRVLATAPSNLQAYGNGLGVWQKLVLTQVYQERTIAQSLIVLSLAELLPSEGTFGVFDFRIEGFEPWRVTLYNKETCATFEFEESLKDFDLSFIPQPFLSRLLNRWFLEYMQGLMRYMKDYKLFLERIKERVKDIPFELRGELEEELKDHLRISLYLALEREGAFKEVAKLLERGWELGINFMDERLKFWLERFIESKAMAGLQEEEALLIAKTIKELNGQVGRYEFMVDLWALKNWLWENKDRVKREELYQLLGCEYT
ncbi:MAG: DUF3536 domain-containing protein [Aquificota bacterium]|nr:MAG: DUF3536 domain-containing protein [Aquificota bacterium]